MTMTHDQLHTHGPDELAMLRAECDKWHKAYDRVWEERMRFADRVIELERDIVKLKSSLKYLVIRGLIDGPVKKAVEDLLKEVEDAH